MSTYDMLAVHGAKLCFKVRGRGPLLLVLQGGGGNADASDGMASVLESEFTIVSYDRRGLLRSPLDDRNQPLSVAQHAEDVLALLNELSLGPAWIFASSLGAMIGLDFVARWPDRVAQLVVHEPPLTELLSPESKERVAAERRHLREIALKEGPRAAFRQQLVNLGIDREDREADAEPPASGRAQSWDTGFLLTREARAADSFRLNMPALLASAAKIVPAYGASSRDFPAAECAVALAARLGRNAVEFPGGHTAYVLRPRAFAETLRGAFGRSVRESYLSFTGPANAKDASGLAS